MRPSAGMLAALSLAFALAACGGGSGTPAGERPSLPGSVATDLAGKSDQIADALQGGDVCGAAQLADELKNAVDAAISGGRIPAAFQDELVRAATELQNEVNCDQNDEQHGHEGKGKDKKKGHDKGTTTLGTTTSTATSTTTGQGG